MNYISFKFCNFKNVEHQKTLNFLLNSYMSDPMGDYPPHDENQQRQLVEDLGSYPTAFVLFLLYDGKYAGMTTCFVNYSTFKMKPYLYVHDVFVLKEYRGKKLGKALMEQLVSISRERGYCKISLEVRDDNPPAQKLYKNIGFKECEPKMHYWEKRL